MAQPLTITQLDLAATEWIEQEAHRTGMPVETVARQLIYLERQKVHSQGYHDHDSLAGTWSDEEAEEFGHAVVDLNQIDPSLWQ